MSDVATIQEVMGAVARLQASVDALAAVGARALVTEADAMPPEVAEAVDGVLAAAGVPDLTQLPPPQRAMVGAFVRSTFGQAGDLLAAPTRPAGWSYTDVAVLEGQGRGSMMVPNVIKSSGEFEDVTSLLDVGTGVGWLAVAATQIWPGCTVVGIDVWETSLARARENVATSGVSDRVELRNQSVADLDDRDRFDLTWVPVFFVPPDLVAKGLDRILAATRTGGRIVVGRYDPPPDPLARATLRLRTIRDGGSWIETDDDVVTLLRDAGWSDVRVIPHGGPPGLSFIGGTKA